MKLYCPKCSGVAIQNSSFQISRMHFEGAASNCASCRSPGRIERCALIPLSIAVFVAMLLLPMSTSVGFWIHIALFAFALAATALFGYRFAIDQA
jgi:hypothetical protein